MSKKIFMIAGEPSGDALGASLIKALKQRGDQDFELVGVGGERMEEQGLKSLLPMEELCVMGLWEVMWQLPRLLKLIHGVVEEIEKYQPDVVLTIDLPDFNFDVAKRLKKRGISKAKIIHYVAPSVWAWRPGRAKKVSRFLDGLLCLFPFEPPYFEKHNLPAKFIGHPIIEKNLDEVNPAKFKDNYEIKPDELVLGIFLGSREREIRKHAPILKETAEFLLSQYPNLVTVFPTLPSLEYDIREHIESWEPNAIITTSQDDKYDAFAACDVAMAVSGTVGLELAYLGIPHVIAYKTHPLTYLIARLLIKVKHVHLANILLGGAVIPEYLQGKCNALQISTELFRLLKYDEFRAEQIEDFKELQGIMNIDPSKTPSEKGVDFVFDILESTYIPEPLPAMPTRAPKPPKEKAKPAAKPANQDSPVSEAQGVYLPDLINDLKAKIGLKKK